MSPGEAREEAAALVAEARQLYAGDAAAESLLDDMGSRLREPLRLAIAGMVKAGKSTLLNAILGELIAPTDAGECTRVVTLYRYADTPSLTLRPRGGRPRRLPVKRVSGKLVFDLGGLDIEEVDRIDVGWPCKALRSLTLIDTPGIASLSRDASARSTRFLTPHDSPSSADAIVYLLRHLHSSDLGFLEAFRDTSPGPTRTVNAVAVLSRADEIGSGRIDSLLSAQKVARRYERHGELSSLALAVLPVAGLLGEAARTLREEDFLAFRELAQLDRPDRERLLISADRFCRPSPVTALTEEVRHRILTRFGIFGVRLAISLIRAGAADSADLSRRMVEHSGLEQLHDFIRVHFLPRSDALKVRAVLDGLDGLLRERPREGSEALREGIERMHATTHDLRELWLLSEARMGGLPLPPEAAAAAVRIVGGSGTEASARLGLPPEASPDVLAARAADELAAWRKRRHSPLTERAGVEVCHIVLRSLEAVASEVTASRSESSPTDVMLAGRPGHGSGQGAGQ